MTHHDERPIGDCFFCHKPVMESDPEGPKGSDGSPTHRHCYEKAEEYADDAPTMEEIAESLGYEDDPDVKVDHNWLEDRGQL